jgi:hypothetical protein
VLNYLSNTPRRMGEWRYSSTILDLGTTWRWEPSLTTDKEPHRYPLDRSLGGSQSQSGCCEEKNKAHCRESNPWSSSPLLYPLGGTGCEICRYPRGWGAGGDRGPRSGSRNVRTELVNNAVRPAYYCKGGCHVILATNTVSGAKSVDTITGEPYK